MLFIKLLICSLQLVIDIIRDTFSHHPETELTPIKISLSNLPKDELIRSEYNNKAFSNDNIFGG
ncbi:hypothetical protein OAO18_08820 [Francisellaceae bacterium]|nr:hypothetical protein [Francisellaceae bacterium]